MFNFGSNDTFIENVYKYWEKVGNTAVKTDPQVVARLAEKDWRSLLMCAKGVADTYVNSHPKGRDNCRNVKQQLDALYDNLKKPGTTTLPTSVDILLSIFDYAKLAKKDDGMVKGSSLHIDLLFNAQSWYSNSHVFGLIKSKTKDDEEKGNVSVVSQLDAKSMAKSMATRNESKVTGTKGPTSTLVEHYRKKDSPYSKHAKYHYLALELVPTPFKDIFDRYYTILFPYIVTAERLSKYPHITPALKEGQIYVEPMDPNKGVVSAALIGLEATALALAEAEQAQIKNGTLTRSYHQSITLVLENFYTKGVLLTSLKDNNYSRLREGVEELFLSGKWINPKAGEAKHTASSSRKYSIPQTPSMPGSRRASIEESTVLDRTGAGKRKMSQPNESITAALTSTTGTFSLGSSEPVGTNSGAKNASEGNLDVISITNTTTAVI